MNKNTYDTRLLYALAAALSALQLGELEITQTHWDEDSNLYIIKDDKHRLSQVIRHDLLEDPDGPQWAADNMARQFAKARQGD
jgi:hypothetical protein